jgi:hypothetical protein
MHTMRTIAAGILVATVCVVTVGADQPRRLFVDSWQGKRVQVKQAMYTLVYNERGRLGKNYRGKREGLTVATPSQGTYFRFAGRDSEEDIVAPDVQEVVERIRDSYQRSALLDIGGFQRIEPVVLVQYDRGGALVVKDVRIDRNFVRISFRSLAPDTPATELATALTIEWPIDLSPALTERPLLDALIRQFVDDVK